VLSRVVLAVVTPIGWAFGVWDDHRPDKRGREGWR
jgi:hypothetical protein